MVCLKLYVCLLEGRAVVTARVGDWVGLLCRSAPRIRPPAIYGNMIKSWDYHNFSKILRNVKIWWYSWSATTNWPKVPFSGQIEQIPIFLTMAVGEFLNFQKWVTNDLPFLQGYLWPVFWWPKNYTASQMTKILKIYWTQVTKGLITFGHFWPTLH